MLKLRIASAVIILITIIFLSANLTKTFRSKITTSGSITKILAFPYVDVYWHLPPPYNCQWAANTTDCDSLGDLDPIPFSGKCCYNSLQQLPQCALCDYSLANETSILIDNHYIFTNVTTFAFDLTNSSGSTRFFEQCYGTYPQLTQCKNNYKQKLVSNLLCYERTIFKNAECLENKRDFNDQIIIWISIITIIIILSCAVFVIICSPIIKRNRSKKNYFVFTNDEKSAIPM
ncbi:MAG: hypothetical protein Harvfovirus26_4 [Harvfovirus sp.]|uniref:Uncharacterized protein n=1 Tax=Harvfovirus sp. TaxID=2487768 RepID=A0A3G5A247_9VIRU|nr:MAG: hypothetical protein Harvfovirus26_4 [Harvfovirus sp.]